MFQQIENLPDHVIGLKITGKITAQDYRDELIPLVEEKLLTHPRIDCLCVVEGQFTGAEPSALWEDLRLGLSKLSHWGRLAIVTDLDWMENSVNLFKIFWPGHLKHFDMDEFGKAREWVCERHRAAIDAEMNEDDGILMLRPSQDRALTVYDFEYVTKLVDNYLVTHPIINGIIILSRKFPGWQGLSAMISHMNFVRDHHRKIQRIAVVTNSPLGKIADNLGDQFIKAEIEAFDYDQLDQALSWIKDNT